MISHLRLATANPGYRPPGTSMGRSGLSSHRDDRTTSLQCNLRNFLHGYSNKPPERLYQTGDMPSHIGGRGHLEGTCVAKAEGLLENKKEKRRRKRKRGGASAEDGNDSASDDYYDEDSSDEEEERKVWKPTAITIGEGSGEGKSSSSNPFSSSSAPKPSSSSFTSASSDGGGVSGGGIDSDIESLKKEGLDWKKTSKYGKKSNKNFEEWLDVIAKKMHEQQVVSEDSLFTCL